MKPKFILSKSVALTQYNKVANFCDIVSYSSKTNPIITKILEEQTNCMFSVHLKNELKNIKDKSRVLFLAQAWSEDEISKLVWDGVKNFVVDNGDDLDTLISFLDKNKTKVNLMLRLKLKERTLRTERYFVFGMASDIINKRLIELKDHPFVGELGIHFHRKTQNMSEWSYAYEIEQAISLKALEAVSIINMGGGLPSEYANTNVKVLESIFNKIAQFRDWLSKRNIKLMLEPGRFIAAPAVKLQTKVVGLHDNNIIVNASVYNSDLDALIVPVKLLVEGELNKVEAKEQNAKAYVIKGITPCSMDLFRYRVYLKDVTVGDTLTFLNAGAYNFHTKFCDLEKIETEVVE